MHRVDTSNDPDRTPRADAPIQKVRAAAFTVPTDAPEADGTLDWSSTTLVVVEVDAAGTVGMGYGYVDAAAVRLIEGPIAAAVVGLDALATGSCWHAMRASLRNQGRPGVAAMAVSAVDAALWDLKGRLLQVPVVTLLGATRTSIEVYGSGGFTSYDDARLCEQLAGWAAQGMRGLKMKIGREPARDAQRVAAARRAVGAEVGLMVDANGALDRKQALALAERIAEHGVTWFEEPVSSDDLDGLRLLRDRVPAPMEVAAGEYGYHLGYFRRMLAAGAVDVLQADATRAAGITGFMAADALCQAFEVPLSAHCAPALHCHPCCAAQTVRHMEGFHDHLRIERMLFEGAPQPVDGRMAPDFDAPGLGLTFRRADAARYAA